jgi:endonuclease/exonuclease/phosphatase family metal-dependent hydrolase
VAAMIRTLRVASWNVREGVPATRGEQSALAVDEIVSLLREHRVDIVGLQEVDFDADSSSAILTAIRSRTELSHTVQHVLSGSSFNSAKFAGVAIASCYFMTDAVERRFLNPGIASGAGSDSICMHDKGLISADLSVHGRELRVSSLHSFPFHVFGRAAEEREFFFVWRDITRALTETAAPSQIVCGDFNTTRRDLILEHRNVALRRANVENATYMGEPLDDILFSDDFSLNSIGVIPNFSDHHLCLTTFSWTEAP